MKGHKGGGAHGRGPISGAISPKLGQSPILLSQIVPGPYSAQNKCV